MNNLIGFLEQHDPGHFNRRENSLESLSKKVKELGFFPLQITWHDIECYWIRVEAKEEGKEAHITWDHIKDALGSEKIMEILKGYCRYENEPKRIY